MRRKRLKYIDFGARLWYNVYDCRGTAKCGNMPQQNRPEIGGVFMARKSDNGSYSSSSIQVLEGLEPGENVITSSYSNFKDADVLKL